MEQAVWNWRKLRTTAAPVADADPNPIRMLGKYRILREIARGAMGVVCEAEDPELDRKVAIKVLRSLPNASESARLRFRREARLSAMLSHPNVVRVFDSGEEAGRMYLVMELVPGRPLSGILGDRKHDVPSMLRLLEMAARGVAAAHEAGIVHRDVKPANILVTEDGKSKVGDFGLAHWLDSDTVLTKEGTPLGTPAYMAPEQVQAGRGTISPATDVYALGVILYEILTGRPPHSGDTAMKLYSRIVGEEPAPPRRQGATIPPELQTICMKALEKDPARRYATAKGFADDLRRHLGGEAILARPPGPVSRGLKWARRHRATSAAAAAGLAGLLAIAAVVGSGAAAKRRSLSDFLGKGQAAMADHRRLRGEIDRLRERVKELTLSVAAEAPDEVKQPLWKAQQEEQSARRSLAERAGRIVSAFTSVLALDPGQREARAALAEFHFHQFEQAERAGDLQAMELNAQMARAYDDGTFGPRLVMEGTLSIDSRPSGATVELLRYEEGGDRRMVARHHSNLGACPLTAAALPAGSHLLILRKEGYRDVRVPVLIKRGATHEAAVNLYTDAEIGDGFVYVPAGPFIGGWDSQQPGGPQGFVAFVEKTGDFFISTHEVTVEEYIEFLNGLIAEQGAEEAQKRSPKNGAGTGRRYWWDIPPGTSAVILDSRSSVKPKQPIRSITWDDADAYVRWRTRQARGRGEPAIYRLPTIWEWEKAARGVDGRAYPWGDHFDAGFIKTLPIHTFLNDLAAVGTYARDESPYGVHDMAASLNEWCGDWFDERQVARMYCGGTVFSGSLASAFQVCLKGWRSPEDVDFSVGFRVVKVREQ